jgi:hypothetical protein
LETKDLQAKLVTVIEETMQSQKLLASSIQETIKFNAILTASCPLSFICTGSKPLSFEVAMILTIVFQGREKIVKTLQSSLFFVVNVEKLKIAASLKASGTEKRYCEQV